MTEMLPYTAQENSNETANQGLRGRYCCQNHRQLNALDVYLQDASLNPSIRILPLLKDNFVGCAIGSPKEA